MTFDEILDLTAVRHAVSKNNNRAHEFEGTTPGIRAHSAAVKKLDEEITTAPTLLGLDVTCNIRVGNKCSRKRTLRSENKPRRR